MVVQPAKENEVAFCCEDRAGIEPDTIRLADVGIDVAFQISTEALQEALAVSDQPFKTEEDDKRKAVVVAPVGIAEPLPTKLNEAIVVEARLVSV